jgi:hypothetical protein
MTPPGGLRDSEILQQSNHVFGVLLDRNRTLRDVRSATMPLEIDRDDGMMWNQRRK